MFLAFFFYFWVGRYNKTLNDWPLGKQSVLLASTLTLGETKLIVSLGASHEVLLYLSFDAFSILFIGRSPTRDLQITSYCSCGIPSKCVFFVILVPKAHVTLIQQNGKRRPLGSGIEFSAGQWQRGRHKTKGLMSRTMAVSRVTCGTFLSRPLKKKWNDQVLRILEDTHASG